MYDHTMEATCARLGMVPSRSGLSDRRCSRSSLPQPSIQMGYPGIGMPSLPREWMLKREDEVKDSPSPRPQREHRCCNERFALRTAWTSKRVLGPHILQCPREPSHSS